MGLFTKLNLFRKHRYSLLAFIAILVFLFYPNIGMYDWEKEVLYCEFIKTSILEYRVFPMFLWNSGYLGGYPAVDQSAFFVGNPETLLFSPFIPLLLILPSVVFLKLQVLIHFLIGWAGIQALSKICSWQPSQTRIFSALFMFSPIIIQHIAIGYVPWINLYFFPWLLYFLLHENLPKKYLGSGMVLAIMILQGGLHVFVWSGFFIAIFSFFKAIFKKDIKSLLLITILAISAFLLSLPRFFTSFQTFSNFGQRFFNGYSLYAFLKWALIPPFFTPPTMDDIELFIEGYIDGVPYWDGNLFWGFLLICVFILPFVFWRSLKNKSNAETPETKLNIYALAATSALILLLSFDGYYQKGISFISDLVNLPALKGMEKYPFRFSIPAYFGFAFVVASYWGNYIDFFTHLLNLTRKLAVDCREGFLRFADYMHRYRKPLIWIMGIFTFFYLGSVFLKPKILEWVNSQITSAYYGVGAGFLAGLMEHADTLPLELYLTKAEMLFGQLNRILVILSVIFVSLWLIEVMYKPKRQSGNKTFSRVLNCPHWLPETFMVLPLLLAFGMWWRVSLATPQESLPKFSMQAPIINVVGASDSQEFTVVDFSPQTLELNISEEMKGKTLILSQIPYQDTRFLEIGGEKAQFIEYKGKTALEIKQPGLISVRVKPHLFTFSVIACGVVWIISLWIMTKSRDIIMPKKWL